MIQGSLQSILIRISSFGSIQAQCNHAIMSIPNFSSQTDHVENLKKKTNKQISWPIVYPMWTEITNNIAIYI